MAEHRATDPDDTAGPASVTAFSGLTADPALILIRHGETEWSKSGQHTGLTDIPLTEAGELQAAAAGNIVRTMLAGVAPALVLSSPRQRARRTAELAGFPPDAVTDDAAEWDYGNYEGLTSPQIHEQDPDWLIWNGVVPGGESGADVTARFDRLIATAGARATAAIDAGGEPGPVLVFSHGHASRCIAARWLNLPVSSGQLFRLGTGAVCGLGFEHGQPAIVHWNLDKSIMTASP